MLDGFHFAVPDGDTAGELAQGLALGMPGKDGATFVVGNHSRAAPRRRSHFKQYTEVTTANIDSSLELSAEAVTIVIARPASER